MAKEIKLPTLNIEEMEKAGLNFGHAVSKLHPKMKPYVAGIKNTVNVIDLEKSAKLFSDALKFIGKLAGGGKVILFVGTKPQAQELVKKTAVECGMPYVTERWLGGTITNFKTIQGRALYIKDLEEKKKSGALEKYTKKERIRINKELMMSAKKFGGIKNMKDVPDAVLVFDMRKDDTCIREAKRKGVPIIGLADTNIDPTLADYPIPANDDAISSISYILEKVKETILTANQ